MAVTLVDTPGAATANSYPSVAYANTYFEAHPSFTSWDELDDAEKPRYLIMATRQIEQEPLAGRKADTTVTAGVPAQALHFPRAMDDGGIPVVVKNAVCEQALYMAERGVTTVSRRQLLQSEGVKRVKFGDVEEEYDMEGRGPSRTIAPLARDMLLAAGLLQLTAGWA